MIGKAAVFLGPKKFEIREYPTPPVESGGVLVRITAGGICGSDLHYWRGDLKPIMPGKPGPLIIGHEMAGIVHELGGGVQTDSSGHALREGDRVVFPYFLPCRRCYKCLRGELNHCPNRFSFRASVEEYPYCSGGFAEYFYVRPGGFIFKAPDGITDEALAPVNCALSQVIYAMDRSNIKLGDTVVVQGAGGLGLYAVAAAKDMGAGLVISIDGSEGRLEMAKKCGADHTINIKDLTESQDRIDRVKEITGNKNGADIAVEVVGFPEVVPEGLEMLCNGGTYVEVGNIWPGSNATIDMQKIVFKMITMIGTAHYDPYILPVALDFLTRTKDKYPLTDIVSHTYPLEDINEAFTDAEWVGKKESGQLTRAIVLP